MEEIIVSNQNEILLIENNNEQICQNINEEICNFCIFGERCSGTNLLQNLVETNFHLEYNNNICHKHFFGFSSLENTNNTLFLCVVRNFYDWIMSFYEKQHHINKSDNSNDSKNMKTFLTQEIHSFDTQGNEIIQDWNYATGCPYKNIFELRKLKNLFFTDILPTKVKNHYLVLYENISNITFQVNFLEKLEREFQLKRKNNSFLPIYYNAQIFNNEKIKKAFVAKKFNERARKCGITPEILNLIDENIDHECEKKLKYDTAFFKNKFQLNYLAKEIITNKEKLKKKEFELNNMIINRNKKLLDKKILNKMFLSPENENEKEVYGLMQKFENNSLYLQSNQTNDIDTYINEDTFNSTYETNVSVNKYNSNGNDKNQKKKNLVQMKSSLKFVA
jgi:hypothetical protein